jgi:hypothetical protein
MMLLIPAPELIARMRAEREKRAARPKPTPPARH